MSRVADPVERDVLEYLDRLSPELARLSDAVWDFAELGFREYRSASTLASFLEEQGFSVSRGTGGIPTAFLASWGEGAPVLGFLGEYDALAGLSQEVLPRRKPRVEGAPGHGCGHNLLGVGSLGAACAVKYAMEKGYIRGTVRFYGCPAEELLAGKVYMARSGCFDDLSVAITWHPGSLNCIRERTGTAMYSVKFRFYGRTAHAAGDPHNGRSALDAVELMNVGANYLREHIPSGTRIHYVITKGGLQPNVVPDFAEVWYFVRAPRMTEVKEVYARLVDVARGASLMTGTTFEIQFLTGCHEVLVNHSLVQVMWRCLEKVGPPVFDEKDIEFALALRETFAIGERGENRAGDDGEDKSGCSASNRVTTGSGIEVLKSTLTAPTGNAGPSGGSSDVGDVSHIVPTVQMSAATMPVGCPGHSWQNAACAGSPIGKKGMFVAAKTMALLGIELLRNPAEIKKAWDEFREKTKGEPYCSPLPEGMELPLDQF
ncbi:MAG TPA: amidohydrolase [Firmicutes bacterium]|nr:amidohydrolase [Candidatus Fermentithermobacillaceae bacterium]